MLEHFVSGLSKAIILTGDELTRGAEVAKKELNPEYIALQSQVKAKVALMKREYKQHSKSGKSSVDLIAAQEMQKWRQQQREADRMAKEMMAEMLADEQEAEREYQAAINPQPVQAPRAVDLLSQLTPEDLQALLAKAGLANVG